MIGLGFLISCLKPCLAGVVCGAAEVEADTPEASPAYKSEMGPE